jgi:hypothetical protein
MANQIVEPIVRLSPEIHLPKVETPIPQAKVHGRLISTRVVGVTFDNRQEVVSKLQMGDRLWLEAEVDNPYDPNAIRVSRSNGEQIGYLNRYLAANIVPYFEAYGNPVKGKVTLLTGSRWDNYSLGVVVTFKLPKPRKNHTGQQFDDWDD